MEVIDFGVNNFKEVPLQDQKLYLGPESFAGHINWIWVSTWQVDCGMYHFMKIVLVAKTSVPYVDVLEIEN